jgi:hypothetical protein
MNLPNDLVLEIILNSDICTIVNLHDTDKQFKKIVNNKNTLAFLSEKYYQPIVSISDLRKICLYEELVPEYGESTYIEGELLRAVQRIKYRFYNDGNRIDHCGEFGQCYNCNHDVCAPRDFLIQYGFKKYIDMVENMDYKKWIDTLEKVVVNYVSSKENNYTLLPIGESAIITKPNPNLKNSMYWDDDSDDY